MRLLYLLLGTNLGDRQANIDAALAALDKAFCGRRVQLTPVQLGPCRQYVSCAPL